MRKVREWIVRFGGLFTNCARTGKPTRKIDFKRLNLEIVCQTPDGRRSMSRPIDPQFGKQPPSNRVSLERTKNGDHCEGAQDGGLDEKNFRGTFDMPGGPRAELLAEVYDRAPRTGLCHANSRRFIEVRIGYFRKCPRVFPKLGLYLIPKSRQSWPWTRIVYDSRPFRVPVQLRQDFGELSHKFLAIFSGKAPDGCGDLVNCAHAKR